MSRKATITRNQRDLLAQLVKRQAEGQDSRDMHGWIPMSVLRSCLLRGWIVLVPTEEGKCAATELDLALWREAR